MGQSTKVHGKPSTKDSMHSLQRTVVMRLAGFIIYVVANMEWIRWIITWLPLISLPSCLIWSHLNWTDSRPSLRISRESWNIWSDIKRLDFHSLRLKWKRKAPTAASTVSATAADDVTSLSNNTNTSSSAKSKSKPSSSQPDTGDDPHNKDFVPPKHPTWRSVELEIEEIPFDQFGNEIVDNLPEVSWSATQL